MVADVCGEFIGRYAEILAYAIDNPEVRLVDHVVTDLIGRNPCFIQNVLYVAAGGAYRETEHFPTTHNQRACLLFFCHIGARLEFLSLI